MATATITHAMTASFEVLVPDLGDVKDVPVIEVLVRAGDEVKVDQILVVLETEKATMDVPSTSAGKVREVRVKIGDKVNEGSVLVLLDNDVAAALEGPTATSAPTPVPEPAAPMPVPVPTPPPPAPAPPVPAPQAMANASTPPAPGPIAALPHASPSIRREARELGVDLARVTGTGPRGRILQTDLQTFVKAALNGLAAAPVAPPASAGTALDLLPWPQVDFAKFGPIERAPLSKIKRISAANLTRNSILIPHVTNFDEADITELEAFRVEINRTAKDATRLTMLAFLIKASAVALKLHPTFNASLDAEELILKRYVHIGFAADTPNGLVVPVIRDADQKGLAALAAEAGTLAGLARDGKLKPADMQGGCFTISSLGGIGGTGFTPIINAPEVAILGAARGVMKPVWDGTAFLPRLILPLTLAWDHRVVDGAAAARFLVTLTGLLGDFRRVSL